jgi:hypothetical protein
MTIAQNLKFELNSNTLNWNKIKIKIDDFFLKIYYDYGVAKKNFEKTQM